MHPYPTLNFELNSNVQTPRYQIDTAHQVGFRMAGIDEGVVQVRADDEDEFTEGRSVYILK